MSSISSWEDAGAVQYALQVAVEYFDESDPEDEMLPRMRAELTRRSAKSDGPAMSDARASKVVGEADGNAE